MDLRGKTILITGAGRGLGAAMAKRLAERGASLALVDLDENGLVAVRDACRAQNVRAETYSANVGVEREVIGVFDRAACSSKPRTAKSPASSVSSSGKPSST
jgi:3-oxoacyl-[acyl-carrier protein] reductase